MKVASLVMSSALNDDDHHDTSIRHKFWIDQHRYMHCPFSMQAPLQFSMQQQNPSSQHSNSDDNSSRKAENENRCQFSYPFPCPIPVSSGGFSTGSLVKGHPAYQWAECATNAIKQHIRRAHSSLSHQKDQCSAGVSDQKNELDVRNENANDISFNQASFPQVQPSSTNAPEAPQKPKKRGRGRPRKNPRPSSDSNVKKKPANQQPVPTTTSNIGSLVDQELMSLFDGNFLPESPKTAAPAMNMDNLNFIKWISPPSGTDGNHASSNQLPTPAPTPCHEHNANTSNMEYQISNHQATDDRLVLLNAANQQSESSAGGIDWQSWFYQPSENVEFSNEDNADDVQLAITNQQQSARGISATAEPESSLIIIQDQSPPSSPTNSTAKSIPAAAHYVNSGQISEGQLQVDLDGNADQVCKLLRIQHRELLSMLKADQQQRQEQHNSLMYQLQLLTSVLQQQRHG